MKKLLLLFGFCLALLFMLRAQTQTFVYSLEGEKILFERNDNIQYIHFVPNIDAKNALKEIKEITTFVDMVTPEIYRCELAGKNKETFLNYVENNGLIASLSSEYRLPGSKTLRWVTKEIYVNVKEEYSIEKAMQLAGVSYTFAQPDGSLAHTYLVQIEGEDIFAASQYLFETGAVAYALPSFHYLQPSLPPIIDEDEDTPNRSSNNWNLKGIETSANTMGINAMDAWNITTGNPNIKIAIIGDGIHQNHSALSSNIIGGYTAPGFTCVGSGGWAACDDYFATRAAGIVASTNDVQANYGVARDAKIYAVKVVEVVDKPTTEWPPEALWFYTSDGKVKDGLQWIKNSTATDIVIFPWEFEQGFVLYFWDELPNISIVQPSIDSLITYGRNGKGIVVVTCTGDYNVSAVSPPSTLPNVISVGATAPNGTRAPFTGYWPVHNWGSNYGTGLDVMAPGKSLTTTNGNGYTNGYESTGGAAAHVAGVAALMLSVNPDLTAAEVKTIIEQTAYKAHDITKPGGIYNYQTTSGRPNGKWHQQMGYGLVDAHAAVLKAMCYPTSNGITPATQTISQNTTWNTPVIATAPFSVANGVTLTVTSTVECYPGTSFTVQPGGKLVINGGTFTSACEEVKWQGITVMGDPTKPMKQTYQGFIQILNGGIIENAVTGITVEGGGMVEATDAEFRDNIINVKFEPLAPGQSGISGTFTETYFICAGDFDHPNDEPHLIMDNCGEVLITDCGFANPVPSGIKKGVEIINTPTQWSGYNMLVSVPITIQSGGVVTNTGKIGHFGSSLVTVHPGGMLHIDGGIHTNAHPQYQWYGIEVLGNPTQPMNQTFQGYVVINGGTIKNASTGIIVQGGGMVKATDAQFINNTMGVKFEPLALGQTGISGTFFNTNFVLNNNYLDNIANHFGGLLKMDNCGDVLVTGGCIFNNQSSTNINNGVIVTNATTTWSGNIQLLSVPVDIKAGATLTNTGIISCDSSATVTVRPGGKLVVSGGTFTHANPNEMWKGITVQGNVDSHIPPYLQGILEVKNGGTIENAKSGITAVLGGIVETSNANFINNRIGIQVDNFSEANFTKTQFVVNAQYFEDILKYGPHLKLSGCLPVTVSGCTFKNETNQIGFFLPNKVNGWHTGILAYNTHLTVKEIKRPFTQTMFSGLGAAIFVNNTGTIPPLSVQNSIFHNNRYSIIQNTVDYSNITNNDFEFTLTDATGLYSILSTGYTITGNQFSQPRNFLATGMVIEKSGSNENVVYKNYFNNLNVGVQAINKNSSYDILIPPVISGLQFLCNEFLDTQQTDILVGDPNTPHIDHSVRHQGNLLQPAGNLFLPKNNQRINVANYSNYLIEYYYSTFSSEEAPQNALGNVAKNPLMLPSECNSKGRGNLQNALSQYDEWNEQYNYWLSQLATTEADNEEYSLILNKVSYYSALKDNYFNGVIVAVMNNDELRITNYEAEEEKSRKAEGGDGSYGSENNYETLRYLFSYRGHYNDYLSMVETFLAENNFREALATVDGIYERFELTSEQVNELMGLRVYVRWLQQLAEKEGSIYKLSESEIEYLVNYVKTHSGRGKVFANNILCGLYNICLEEGEEVKSRRAEEEKSRKAEEEKGESNGEGINLRKSVSSACKKTALENITLVPNPTTGELRITNYELRIENIEIYDVYGRKTHSFTPSPLHSLTNINISHINSGIYFVKIITEDGEVVKKVVKQ